MSLTFTCQLELFFHISQHIISPKELKKTFCIFITRTSNINLSYYMKMKVATVDTTKKRYDETIFA